MSTLKTHNLQSPDSGSANVALASNAGMVVTGISTFSNNIIANTKIGIGTKNPSTLTHIYDDTDTSSSTEQFRISGGDRTADTFETGFRFFTQSPSANGNRHVRFTSNGNTGLEIQPIETSSGNAAVDRHILLCPSGGKVSVLTTNTSEGVLQVNGDITAKKLHGGRMYGMLAGRNFDGNNAMGGYAIEYASGYESPYIVAYNNTSSPSANNITFGSLSPSDRNLNTGLTKLVEINANTGNTTLKTGNLVLATSGKGIDFSATSNNGTSELLDDYEEGSWTPTAKNAGSFTSPTGRYVKVGHQVTVWGYIPVSTNITSSSNFEISGLPYTSTSSNHVEFVGPCMLRYINSTSATGVSFSTYQGSNWNYLRIYSSRDDGNNYEAVKHADFGFDVVGVRFCHSYTVG